MVLDGVCDTDPTPVTLGTAPTTSVLIPGGVQVSVETMGLRRLSWLVFYKVRGLSPCTATPGPFYAP